jgi:hypothetical protein
MPDPNIMGSLADQSTYDPATGMPYPGNAPDYGDLSQRMTNAQQRIAAGLYEAGAMPGRAFGTVPGGPPTPEEEANWGAGTAFGMLGASRLPGGAPAGAVGAGGAKLVQPDVFLGGAIGGPWEGGIKAYHSSPFSFTRFDPAKAYTGEGANSYGHGAAYLAENPAVSGQGGQYWNQFANRFSGNERQAAARLSEHGFNRDAAIQSSQKNIDELRDALVNPPEHFRPEQLQQVQQMLAARQAQHELLTSGNPVGPRTYEVNINARPEQMLNLDAPLYQQGPRVADAFKNITGMELGPPTGLTGAPDAREFIRSMGRMKSPEYVSAAFNDAGIPGSRYLDQGSRLFSGDAATLRAKQIERALQESPGGGSPEDIARVARLRQELARLSNPTSNYVIFDPNKIDIRKMYAVPGAVGAGAAGMGALATQDNYQPQ